MDLSDVLLDYFDLLSLDHRVSLNIRAHKLLLQIGHTDHLEVFNVLQAMSDEYESYAYFDRVEQLLIEHLLDNITEFGVSISNEKLEILIEILEALYTIESRDDTSAIHAICTDDGDSDDIFAEILAHIYGRSEMEYLDCFRDIDPGLINKIESITEPTMLEEFQEIEKAEEKEVSKLKELVKYTLSKVDAPVFRSMLEDGVKLGYAHSTYMLQIDDTEDLSITQYTNEYLVSYIASGEEIDALQDKLSVQLELMYDNLPIISEEVLRVVSLVNEIKVHSYGTN